MARTGKKQVTTRKRQADAKNGTLPKFTMEFQPDTINHLGHRLYHTMPPVIAELVSNAYDSDAKRVEIHLPPGQILADSEVRVRDYGHGMTVEEIQNEYLPIGRNRRGRDSSMTKSKSGERAVTGRKGLGKLSAFGVAVQLKLRSFKNGRVVTLLLDKEQIDKWSRTYGNSAYEPQVIEAECGATQEEDGVEITLRKMTRTKRIDPEELMRGLAIRLAMIGSDFQVLVGGTPIGPGYRTRKTDCVEGLAWDLSDLPGGARTADGETLEGWIGFVEKSATGDRRGLDLYANNKAVQLASFFAQEGTHASVIV